MREKGDGRTRTGDLRASPPLWPLSYVALRPPSASLAGAAASIALILTGCITGYSREAPMAVYPAGELSGPPTWFLGWKWRL